MAMANGRGETWEHGYRCVACGYGPLSWCAARAAARHRLCIVCYETARAERRLGGYRERRLPPRKFFCAACGGERNRGSKGLCHKCDAVLSFAQR